MRRCRRRGCCAPKLLEEAPADQNIRLFQRLQPQISSSHFVRRRDLLARFENYIPTAFVPARERWTGHGRGNCNSKSRRLLTNSKSRRLLGLVREANCVHQYLVSSTSTAIPHAPGSWGAGVVPGYIKYARAPSGRPLRGSRKWGVSCSLLGGRCAIRSSPGPLAALV